MSKNVGPKLFFTTDATFTKQKFYKCHESTKKLLFWPLFSKFLSIKKAHSCSGVHLIKINTVFQVWMGRRIDAEFISHQPFFNCHHYYEFVQVRQVVPNCCLLTSSFSHIALKYGV